eukprot:5432377-Prymnesium_polylepis.1
MPTPNVHAHCARRRRQRAGDSCAAPLPPPAAAVAGAIPGVVLSYAVCGTDAYAALRNGVQFTQPHTPLYAHACRGSAHR